jgi:hypothetical protein
MAGEGRRVEASDVGDSAPSLESVLEREALAWRELHDVVRTLSPGQIETAGYFAEGWSVKDMLGHIGSWLAEAGVALERMHGRTYRPDELDVDAENEAFLEAIRPLSLADIRAQAEASRHRMLASLRTLPEIGPEAVAWLDKAGPAHYDEHLPRLREWVAELRSA